MALSFSEHLNCCIFKVSKGEKIQSSTFYVPQLCRWRSPGENTRSCWQASFKTHDLEPQCCQQLCSASLIHSYLCFPRQLIHTFSPLLNINIFSYSLILSWWPSYFSETTEQFKESPHPPLTLSCSWYQPLHIGPLPIGLLPSMHGPSMPHSKASPSALTLDSVSSHPSAPWSPSLCPLYRQLHQHIKMLLFPPS